MIVNGTTTTHSRTHALKVGSIHLPSHHNRKKVYQTKISNLIIRLEFKLGELKFAKSKLGEEFE